MPPHRKPVSLLHTVSLFGCHIRSSKEGLISFLLTWPGIHSLVIGTGAPWRSENHGFSQEVLKVQAMLIKDFPVLFLELLKRKDKVGGTCISKKLLTYLKTKKQHVYGRRHCRKQMGWLATHDLVPKEHVPIMAGARLQECDSSPAFSEFANNNHNPSKLILIDHNFSSKHIQTAFFSRNARCISPRVFFFTNLTHWCFAKLLEVVHSAGPYELVRSLFWKQNTHQWVLYTQISIYI